MAQYRPPPMAAAPYTNNYSFHGMQHLNTNNEPMSQLSSESVMAGPAPQPPLNDYMDTATVVSDTTIRPTTGGSRSGHYPQEGHTPYRRDQHERHPNQGSSYTQPYPAEAWQQDGQSSTYQGYGYGRPMSTVHEGRPMDYTHGRPPPPQHQRPPTQYNRSDYDSDDERSDNRSDISGQERPNTFLNSLKEGLKSIELMEFLPIAGVISASAYHYLKHRNSKNAVPFKEPEWMRYLSNIAFAHNAYSMFKHKKPSNNNMSYGGGHGHHGHNNQHGRHNGQSKYTNHGVGSSSSGGGGSGGSGIPWAKILGAVATSAMARPGGGGGGGYGNGGNGFGQGPFGQNGGRPNAHMGGNNGDMVTNVLGKIMSGLFKGNQGGRTRDLESSGHEDYDDVLSGFDDGSAVQKVVAEHYYRSIYRKNMNMQQVNAQTMGGAAAIKALRSEEKMSQQLEHTMFVPPDLRRDQMVMGLALSEAEDLLERKAQCCPLRPEDTMENVGKIALATIIKLKMDEEVTNNHRGNSSRSTGTPSHRRKETSRHNDNRHTHRNKDTQRSHHTDGTNRNNYDQSPLQDPYNHRQHHPNHNQYRKGASAPNSRNARDDPYAH
ncbi:hypothetical protein COEREDRAFT_83692 [Coemansia reversa NRRL 1564]|uniref:Uncharacterized protein n=1 Tax=Coemansia reversa (strain ATCC 12441 / NRRL 1564) TaxID=763665 RepID=A0A2G5B284_COERN|nr:hypothetical protein COEREDRAFT_83692 [Coemansia reversa NRRL 1564]|eukprot:PIA13116.1 hypothetical protein COEREDRAFT_83692 [Coemansia reversa NRRL 1564]